MWSTEANHTVSENYIFKVEIVFLLKYILSWSIDQWVNLVSYIHSNARFEKL